MGVLVLLLLVGQVRGVEAGSAAEARALARNARTVLEAEVDPNSKKVGKAPEASLEGIPAVSGPSSRTLEKGTRGLWPDQFQVVQVLGKDRVLATYYFEAHVRVLMVKGFPTEGLADGDNFVLVEPAKVGGTESYLSAVGAKRTVQVVEPLSKEEFKNALEEAEKVRKSTSKSKSKRKK